MTCALYFFQQRLAIVRRVCRHVSVRLLRKIVQKRKLETIQNPIVSFPIGLYSINRPNFHSDFPCVNIMPEMEYTTGDDEGHPVEYLEPPIKSENDKKEYR